MLCVLLFNISRDHVLPNRTCRSNQTTTTRFFVRFLLRDLIGVDYCQSEFQSLCWLRMKMTVLINIRQSCDQRLALTLNSDHYPCQFSYCHLFQLSLISSQSVFLLLICPPPRDEFQISAWQTPWPPRQQAAGTGYASPSCLSRQFECVAPADTSTRSSCGQRRPAAVPRPCRPPGPPGRSSSPSPSAGAHSSLGTPYPGHYIAEEEIKKHQPLF